MGRWLLISILQEADLALRGPGAFLEASSQDSMGGFGSWQLAVDAGTAGVMIFIISNGSGYSFPRNFHFSNEILTELMETMVSNAEMNENHEIVIVNISPNTQQIK